MEIPMNVNKINRRRALQTLGASAAALASACNRPDATSAVQQNAPAPAVAGARRFKYTKPVIDLHFHWYPPEFVDLLEREGMANGAIVRHGEGGEVIVQTPIYKRGFNGEEIVLKPSSEGGGGEGGATRFADPSKTNVDVMLKDMDTVGIDVDVVTQTNPHIIWAPPQFGLRLAQAINDGNSRLHQQHPKRFIGTVTLPMQDVKLSLQELDRAAKLPGMRAINVTENVRGLNIGDQSFWPIYARAEQLGLPLFLKNVDTISERMVESNYSMMNILSNPFEATMAAASLMLSGALDEFPKLEVYLPHAGGFFAFVNPRIAYARENMNNSRLKSLKQPVDAYLRRFYYDLILHSPQLTRTLIEMVGTDHVACGTDRPQAMNIKDPIAYVEAIPGMTERDAQMILCDTPARLIKL
jgi:aminocarboxymuconate-semialdehyde decarboxylase